MAAPGGAIFTVGQDQNSNEQWFSAAIVGKLRLGGYLAENASAALRSGCASDAMTTYDLLAGYGAAAAGARG
jgi:hypothetical protein